MKKLLLLLALVPFTLSAQLNITFKSQLNYQALGLHGTTGLSNLWGYADEMGNEYAIVGLSGGVSIVDVTDPTTPVEVFFEPGLNSIWREVKTYNNYAYITTEANEGMMIIDLNPLPGAITSANVTHFFGPAGNPWISAHSLFIDETTGVLFLHGSNRGNGGVILYDLNSSPTNPTELGEFDNWYVHDSYSRGDTLYSAHIYDGFFTVTDVSNPASITIMGGPQNTPKNFAHNCWLSDNGDYLFTTDEVSGSWLTSYDITDLSDIKELDRIRNSETSGSIAHNTYWINNYLVTSYYRDGVTIHDVTDPSNMILVGHYDTSPLSGDGFNGAWGVYPYLPSGNLLVSDIEQGLFVLAPDYQRAAYLEGNVTDAVTGVNLNNVHVEVVSTPNFDNTDLAGQYSTGVATAGTYDVIYTKAGYYPETVSVNLVSATTVTQDVALVPIATTTLSGTVTLDGTTTPINNIQVVITNNDYSYSAVTNSAGVYTISGFVLDTANNEFNITVGGWGYVTYCADGITVDGTAMNFSLEQGFYDDFALDFGWTTSATSPTGHWVRETPIPAFVGFTISNPGTDITSDCSNKAFVTGNADNNMASVDDVDDGNAILTSPVFNTTGLSDAWISLHVWFANDGGTGAPNDTLILTLLDGSNAYVIAKYRLGNFPFSSWNLRTFRVNDYTAATTNLRLRVTVTDYNPGHVVDAAIDVFRVTEGNPLTGLPEQVMIQNGLEVYPNPASESITVNSVYTLQTVQVIDMTGKMVMNKTTNDMSVMLDLSTFQKGIYSIRTIDVNGKVSSARIVKQ